MYSILFILLLFMAGCEGNKQSADDFITVDVTAKYPYKKLILQDFMDVEYIPLETNDEFVCGNFVRAVGRNHVIVTNRSNDGNIYVFDRKGRALRKINRKGQGGEEYNGLSSIVLDEDNNELFINDSYSNKIQVYDLKGNFKRKLSTNKDFLFVDMYNFDEEHLICHDSFNDNSTVAFHAGQSFMLISKLDGSISKEIQIPYEEKKSIVIKTPKDEKTGLYHAFMPSTVHPIVPYFADYALNEISADTIYCFSDHMMKPLVVRTPSVCSMTPERFLLLSLLTDRYYFMRTMKKELDYKTFKGFPGTDLFYDKQEKTLSQFTMYNGDYSNKRSISFLFKPRNSEIAISQSLQAPDLVEAYEKGQLKGKLKEIAAGLDEEANPVIMLAKYKK